MPSAVCVFLCLEADLFHVIYSVLYLLFAGELIIFFTVFSLDHQMEANLNPFESVKVEVPLHSGWTLFTSSN